MANGFAQFFSRFAPLTRAQIPSEVARHRYTHRAQTLALQNPDGAPPPMTMWLMKTKMMHLHLHFSDSVCSLSCFDFCRHVDSSCHALMLLQLPRPAYVRASLATASSFVLLKMVLILAYFKFFLLKTSKAE
jgi:hypothetical protein